MSEYTILIKPIAADEGGGFLAFFPDLPGCLADGETVQEALENALDALSVWTEVQKDRNIPMPEPGSALAESVALVEGMQKTIAELEAETEDLRKQVQRNRIPRLEKWRVVNKARLEEGPFLHYAAGRVG